MNIVILMYILVFVLVFIAAVLGFILGCKWQEQADLLRELKDKHVDNPRNEIEEQIKIIAPPVTLPGVKHDVSQSRVMKYPTPKEIRKRRENEALRSYEAERQKNPRPSGTYVA